MSKVNLNQALAIAEESEDGGLIRNLVDEVATLRGVLRTLLGE